MEEPSLVLASASPRRSELLRAAGVRFRVEPSGADETLPPGTEPEAGASELALRKAAEVAERHAGERLWVLGADTVVALGEGPRVRLLGKPADEAEARGMLEALSGSRHRVVTGVAVLDCLGARRRCVSFERTWVRMRTIEPREIAAYAASGEWRGKAGGYAIQENADRFVIRLDEGGFDNVVGLPVALSLRLLAECGATL